MGTLVNTASLFRKLNENQSATIGEGYSDFHIQRREARTAKSGLFLFIAPAIIRIIKKLMDSSIHIRTKVLPGHRNEIAAPQWSEGASVDVLVRLEGRTNQSASRADLLRMPVEQRRQILMQQSEHMTEYYNSDEDRSDWQGGDIIK